MIGVGVVMGVGIVRSEILDQVDDDDDDGLPRTKKRAERRSTPPHAVCTSFPKGPSMICYPSQQAGWKDTVHAVGGHVTSIVVRFPTADELGFDPDAIFSSDPT